MFLSSVAKNRPEARQEVSPPVRNHPEVTSPSSPPPTPIPIKIVASSELTLAPGATVFFDVAVDRAGFAGPLQVVVEGLPAAVGTAPVEIPAEQSSAKVVLLAAQDAVEGSELARIVVSSGTKKIEQSLAVNVKKMATSEVVAPAGTPTTIQDKSISVVRQWINSATLGNLVSGNLKLKILGAWFDSDHVYVEVLITNAKGPGVIGYKSWNGAGKVPEETAAILLDDKGRVCSLVPRERAPDPGRRRTAEVAMGETVSDILVFEAPKEEFSFVKLVLPQSAIGRDGAFGFQIPRDWVAPYKARSRQK